MSFCTNCGFSLNEGDRFCPDCGAKVVDVTIPQPQAPEQAQTQPSEVIVEAAGAVGEVVLSTWSNPNPPQDAPSQPQPQN